MQDFLATRGHIALIGGTLVGATLVILDAVVAALVLDRIHRRTTSATAARARSRSSSH